MVISNSIAGATLAPCCQSATAVTTGLRATSSPQTTLTFNGCRTGRCSRSHSQNPRHTPRRKTMETSETTYPAAKNAKAAGLLSLLIGLNAWGQDLEAPFKRLTSGPWNESANSICVASCDIDNNGWPDLFVGHFDTPSSLYRNDNGTFTKVTTGPVPKLLPSAHGAAFGDLDNDGWPDLVVTCLVD